MGPIYWYNDSTHLIFQYPEEWLAKGSQNNPRKFYTLIILSSQIIIKIFLRKSNHYSFPY